MNTEIPLPVTELKAALPGLAKVISRRSTLPVLGCVRIERNAQGDLSLQATDLDDYLTVRFPGAAPATPGACLVPWEPFARAIKAATREENVVLLVEGGLRLRTFIGSSPVDQRLEAIDLKEWPATPVIEMPGMAVSPEMRQALREALECASQDESRLILNSVYLDVATPGAHYVVGTNGRALFSANSFTFDLKESLVIPARRFLGWSGLWEGEGCWLSRVTDNGKEPGWVQFRTERWTFITRQIEGNYPNWKQIIPGVAAKTTLKLSQAACDGLRSVIPKLPGKAAANSPITLTVANGHLEVQGRGRLDENSTVIPIDGVLVSGNDTAVACNRDYLLRALQFGLSEILLFDPQDPVMICQTPGKRMLIALLKSDTVSSPNPITETKSESTTMSKTTETSTPQNAPAEAAAEAAEAGVKSVVQQIEQIKDALKGVIGDFNEVLASLKTAEKEKKASEKEIESIRTTLRSLQKVQL